MTVDWIERLADDDPPQWLGDLAAEPHATLERLLAGAAWMGDEARDDPAGAVIDWALALLDDEEFVATLDAAMAVWIERHAEPARSTDPRSEARAWMRASAIMRDIRPLPRAATRLQDLAHEWRRWLAPLVATAGPRLLEDFLTAVAVNQTSRALDALWARMVALDDEVHVELGQVGLLGIQHLPPSAGERRGGFRPDLADAFVAYARAAQKLVAQHLVSDERALDALATSYELLRAAYPFPQQWRAALSERADETMRAWLERVAGMELVAAPPVPEAHAHGAPSARGVSWANAQETAYKLIQQAIEHRERDPGEAATLARQAIRWAPSNPYGWTTLMRALRNGAGPRAALPTAWEAVERFPENEVCRQELAAFLRESDRTLLAEQVWIEGIERFPDDGALVNSYASFLLDENRVLEARDVLEPFAARHPTVVASRRTLGDAYRRLGQFPQAEEIFGEAVVERPDPYAWGGRLRLLVDTGRTEEAQRLLAEARRRFPDVAYFTHFTVAPEPARDIAADESGEWDREHTLAELRVLRRALTTRELAGEEAATESLIEELAESGRERLPPPGRLAELGMALVATGRADDALAVLEDAYRAFPFSVELAYALSRARMTHVAHHDARYSPRALRELTEPLRQAQATNAALRPLVRLHAVHAAGALCDGQALASRRAELVAHLRDELTTRAPALGAFGEWWSTRVLERLPAQYDTGLSPDDAPTSGLAEDYVVRAAAVALA